MRDYYAKENAKKQNSMISSAEKGAAAGRKSQDPYSMQYTSPDVYKEPNKIFNHEEQRLRNYSSNRAAEIEAQRSAAELSSFKNKKNLFGGEGSAEEMEAASGIANKAIEAGAAKEAAEAASETAREAMRATGAGTGAVPKGFLANVWNSIKSWGKGLMEKFPGLGKFLKNGVSWVTDPANAWKIAAGAGAAALGAIALRIRNKKKREAFLAASKQKPV
jgi:hypothetical protein